ncbi:hypothetical protein ABGB14_34855 [Nonomuraea sp. B10E15]|uniref:hypothetical protein n=1 Tax=Nonomuraea sp. B10E15 TaxID=3153560 RepID=UPI00325DFE36
MCSDLVAQLRKERERITHAIKDLQASQGMLDAVIAAGPADAAPAIQQPVSKG